MTTDPSRLTRRLKAFVTLSALCLALSPVGSPLGAAPADTSSKIRGVVFTGPASAPFEQEAFTSMRDVGATHVALVPEGTVDLDTLEIRHDFRGQWYGETRDATVEGIRLARAAGLQVMIKPHLAVPRMWRGELDVEDEAKWQHFAANYRGFILSYALLAEEAAVEVLCLGTELKRLALGRPELWRNLARDVRRVYHGKLTYAANWDSFDHIQFWDALDLIGVDAYFPVSDARTPKPDEVAAGWQTWAERLAAVHERFDRPVIFTEWGYELEDYAGKEPWVIGGGRSSDTAETAQANAYEGTFRGLWSEPWMEGIFVWRWSPRAGEPGRYSPRGLQAEEVLRRWFSAR